MKEMVFICVYLIYIYIWMFPKIGVPQNGWFIMENPIRIRMDDLGGNTPIFGNTHILWIDYDLISGCLINFFL